MRQFALRVAASASVFALAGVMLCAFVTRSGMIRTIHGYAGDSASAWMFAVLAVAFAVIGAGVCRIRRFEVNVGQMGKEDDDV